MVLDVSWQDSMGFREQSSGFRVSRFRKWFRTRVVQRMFPQTPGPLYPDVIVN